jgi:murein DD-endopeptidase MepM/ murein hydrolase activator NlpD
MKNKYTSLLKRTMTWTVICALPIVATFLFSKTAHAGLLSFVNSILGGEQVSASVSASGPVFNSQTMPVLKGNVAFNPTAVLADQTIPLDDGGQTLLPDIASNNTDSTDAGNLQKSTYTAQQGDTLGSIANMFDISIDTIKQANNLTSNTVKPGQTLTILPVSGILYTVQARDSLQLIADKTKSSVSDILTYNDLTISSIIKQGQQLIIPHGKPSTSDIQSFLSTQKVKVPSFEPILDAVWNWPSYPDYFSCPIPGARLSQGLHGHNAIDLAIARGTPIRAAAAGVVIVSKSNISDGHNGNGGYGNFVMISHSNGSETLYAHMSKTAVTAGEQVSKGQTIGYVGMTGLTTGPHTHFEIRQAQNPFVDPALCR